MGDYTELLFRAEIKEDTPFEITHLLFVMLGDESLMGGENLSHPLFGTRTRWRHMFTGDSAYFPLRGTRSLRRGMYGNPPAKLLHVHTQFKEQVGEISLFVDWIAPHLVAEPGEFLGYWIDESLQSDSFPAADDVHLIVMPEK